MSKFRLHILEFSGSHCISKRHIKALKKRKGELLTCMVVWWQTKYIQIWGIGVDLIPMWTILIKECAVKFWSKQDTFYGKTVRLSMLSMFSLCLVFQRCLRGTPLGLCLRVIETKNPKILSSVLFVCYSSILSEIRELQRSIKTYDLRYFQSMFYCVQVLYTTNQETSVFRDI